MPLLTNPQLEASPIVANNRMNRERNLAGSNGYDRELRLHPLELLADVIRRRGQASWLDLCCGTGRALVEAAQRADAANLPLTIVGVDLAGLFFPASSPRLTRHEASLTDWQPDRSFNLITCVHGLHYIGDKLGLLARAAGWLTDDGLLVGNLDLANLRLADGRPAARVFAAELRRQGFEFSSRHRLVRRTGRSVVDWPLRYLGADDQAGPNSTGQPAVNSYYERTI